MRLPPAGVAQNTAGNGLAVESGRETTFDED